MALYYRRGGGHESFANGMGVHIISIGWRGVGVLMSLVYGVGMLFSPVVSWVLYARWRDTKGDRMFSTATRQNLQGFVPNKGEWGRPVSRVGSAF